MIAQLHASYAQAALSLPASAAIAVEDERLAAEVADTGEVTRRYARLAAEYRYLAYQDPLTELPNRRAFDDRMIALDSPGEQNALLVIDVNEFKTFNDTQGHEAGDALLRRARADNPRRGPRRRHRRAHRR